MIIQCPDCQTKMKPTVPETVAPGTKIGVTCRCGSKLRFTYPGPARNLEREEAARRVAEAFRQRDSADPFAAAMSDLMRSIHK